MATLADRLDELVDVSRVRLVDATRARHSVVSAAVRPRAVDTTLEEVRRLGVLDADISLTRAEVVGSLATGRAEASLVWADVIGTAWLNARPIARYLAFMFVAGVIACYGVIDDNTILIVGAMAVSPDLLPITAIGVGIATRHLRLAARAALTLALGLAVASLSAALFAFAQDRFDRIPVPHTLFYLVSVTLPFHWRSGFLLAPLVMVVCGLAAGRTARVTHRRSGDQQSLLG